MEKKVKEMMQGGDEEGDETVVNQYEEVINENFTRNTISEQYKLH